MGFLATLGMTGDARKEGWVENAAAATPSKLTVLAAAAFSTPVHRERAVIPTAA